jgi:hypothetical protein
MLFGKAGRRQNHHNKHKQMNMGGEGRTNFDFAAHTDTDWRLWDHWQLMHVHDPSLPDLDSAANSRLNCKLLQQLTFSLTTWPLPELLSLSRPFPQWAFCHTRPVKSRTFVHALTETPNPFISAYL